MKNTDVLMLWFICYITFSQILKKEKKVHSWCKKNQTSLWADKQSDSSISPQALWKSLWSEVDQS